MKLALVTVGLLVFLAVGFLWQRAEQRVRIAEARAAAADSTMRALDAKAAWQPAEGVQISAQDLEDLKAMGFADPVRQLGDDLVKHPELIPYQAEMGGTMAFRQPVRVISSRWLYANFDDGHVAGSAIMEFQVLKDGTLGWKMRASRME